MVGHRNGVHKRFAHFAVNRDLLYGETKKHDEVIEQPVLPQSFRCIMLHLTHAPVLGGHLRVAKSQEWVFKKSY